MKDAILFDLDGTLTNTDDLHFEVWQALVREYGLEIDQAFYDRHVSGRLNKDIIPDILPQLSAEAALALSDRKEAEFRRQAATALVPLPGLMPLLAWIDAQGLKKSVVTNAPVENAYFTLQVLDLKERFPVVVIGEQCTFGKPHPMPYQVSLERLGVSPEQALVFEDSPTGIQSAVGAGLFTVGIASTHAANVLYDSGASVVITDFTDPVVMQLLQDKR